MNQPEPAEQSEEVGPSEANPKARKSGSIRNRLILGALIGISIAGGKLAMRVYTNAFSVKPETNAPKLGALLSSSGPTGESASLPISDTSDNVYQLKMPGPSEHNTTIGSFMGVIVQSHVEVCVDETSIHSLTWFDLPSSEEWNLDSICLNEIDTLDATYSDAAWETVETMVDGVQARDISGTGLNQWDVERAVQFRVLLAEGRYFGIGFSAPPEVVAESPAAAIDFFDSFRFFTRRTNQKEK